ncbi:hypothetical protein P5673_016393 [Acropora cervicornis]|uniref:Uncharacterized protein n=1 Tax=Acropora cervicornis TaxID=6130 RepID=A0AAD9QG45_ACRCE|nr:hypothetical protein P5673_016393 [Acropora cervicornis]
MNVGQVFLEETYFLLEFYCPKRENSTKLVAGARQLIRLVRAWNEGPFLSASIPCFVNCNQENPNEFNAMSSIRCEMIIMIRMS